MPSLAGSSQEDRLNTLNQKTYLEQAEWLLNAKWADLFQEEPDRRESIWKSAEMIAKMDKDLGKNGSALKEINAHIFIEKQGDAVTWSDFRDYMRSQEFGFDKRKNMSLTDFFVFQFKLDWKELVDAESFDPEAAEKVNAAKAQFAEAEDQLNKATANSAAAQAAAEQAADSLEAAEAATQEATEAADAAKTAEELAKQEAEAATAAAEAATAASEKADVSAKAAAAAKEAADAAATAAESDAEKAKAAAAEAESSAEAAAKAAETQAAAEKIVQETLDFIQGQEDSKNAKLAKLKAISEDESAGVVKKGKAFQEFKKLEGEDPLPLREAKIKQGAQVRKAKKATKSALNKKLKADKAATAAKEAATQAEATATAAMEAATEASAKADEAASDAESAKQEAESAELTREAAEKSAKDAAEKSDAADAAQKKAEEENAKALEDKHAADAAAEAAEESVKAATTSVEAAEAALEALKATLDTGGAGTLWLMSRDLEEKKKYMPSAKFRAAERKAKKAMAKMGGAN